MSRKSNRHDASRLDANESWFFEREMEAIDGRVYEREYPEFQARSFLSTITSVDETDKVYTYRMTDRTGKARWIEGKSTDAPRAGVMAAEKSQTIKRMADSYSWDIWEIKAAAKASRPLDDALAFAARQNIEELIDETLAYGDSTLGLKGFLTLASGTTPFTLSTKSGGGTTWANGTGEEMANDLLKMANNLVDTTKGVFRQFRCVLPLELFNLAAVTKLGALNNTTVLQYVQSTSPYIKQIEPWYRASTVPGVSGSKRIVMWADDPKVIGALVPQEFTTLPPQRVGFEEVVYCAAACGGVVERYPLAISYGDGG